MVKAYNSDMHWSVKGCLISSLSMEKYVGQPWNTQPWYSNAVLVVSRSLISAFFVRCLDTSSCFGRNFKNLASLCSWAGRFKSYQIGNLEDRFTRDRAHFKDVCDWIVSKEQTPRGYFYIYARSQILRRWSEPRHAKTCLRGLRPGKTQTGLFSYRD